MRLFFLIFLAMVSCDHQRTTQPHHIKDSLAYDIESIKIIPSNDIRCIYNRLLLNIL